MTHLEITLLEELLKANAQVAILRRYSYQLSEAAQTQLREELKRRNLALADQSRAEVLRIVRETRKHAYAAS